MCGIVAYLGPRQAQEVIIKGLKRLEYRGYDSAGIALMNGGLNVYKKKGKVTELEATLKGLDLDSHIGMGHTRWATHGEPNDGNAHPHFHCLVLVPPSYFAGRAYMKKADWIELWCDCMRFDYKPVIDVKAVKSGDIPT